MQLQTFLLAIIATLFVVEASIVKRQAAPSCECSPICDCVKEADAMGVLEDLVYTACETQIYGEYTMSAEEKALDAEYDQLGIKWDQLEKTATAQWASCMQGKMEIPCMHCVTASSGRKRRDVTVNRRKRSLVQRRRKRQNNDSGEDDPVYNCAAAKMKEALTKKPRKDFCKNKNPNSPFATEETDEVEVCYTKCCTQSSVGYERAFEQNDNTCWEAAEKVFAALDADYKKLENQCKIVYKDYPDVADICSEDDYSE